MVEGCFGIIKDEGGVYLEKGYKGEGLLNEKGEKGGGFGQNAPFIFLLPFP